MHFQKLLLTIFCTVFFNQFSFSQNDCTNAIVACGNSNFTGLSATGSGIQELNGTNNCSSQETNSIWLKVNIQTTGTLAFTLTPESTNINLDFDFFIFGPSASCGSLGSAIRCSTTNPSAANQGNNLTGLSLTETDVNEGPGADGNSFVKAIIANPGETYFIVIDRPIVTGANGNNNFSLQWTGTAGFSQAPTISTAVGSSLNISKCDNDGVQDNITAFDLTQNDTPAIGTQSNVVVTYHTNLNDAITNSSPISTPGNFRNTNNPQEIHIRLTNTITGCFTNDKFTIRVTPFTTNNPANIEECDSDSDGFVTFNLSQNTTHLVNGDPNLTVSYHPADGSNIVIPNSYTNQIASTNETVWAKIASSNGCFIYKPFDLIINTIPNVTPAQITQCDFELSPDGLTTFNLQEAIPQLTAGNSNFSVKFYPTPTDADNNTNEILNNNFNNLTNPQIIGVRIINNITNCYNTTTLTLNTSVNPTNTYTISECDNDDNQLGITDFDLTEAGLEIGGNIVSYYLSSTDALLEQNSISSNFTNTIPNLQQVYARVENTGNCVGIHILDLLVKPLPLVEKTDQEVFCLNTPSVPTRLDAGIGNQNPNDFTYLWTPDGQTTQTIDVFQSGTYTVSVTSNNCSITRTITVTDSDLASVEQIAIIDLSDNNSVTIFVQGDETDYTYSLDAPNGPFQESNHFEDVIPGIHYLYINDKDYCGILKYEISVLGVPNFFTPNGDGINDTWKITGMEKGHYKNTQIYIFDRYGKLLKQVSTTGDGWNGLFNGFQMPSDDYWYLMQLEDGRTSKGHFSLKR